MALKIDEEELLCFNETNETRTSFSKPVSSDVIVSLTYVVIFVTGILGNIMTCIVIAWKLSMHTDTNLYLFNLAIADLFLLICGLPLKMYQLWKVFSYSLIESLCITLALISDMTANATILTMTVLAVERYKAICCPFILHKTFNLSKTVRNNIVIWACTLCSIVPQAIQFGIIIYKENGQIVGECTVIQHGAYQIFAVSSFYLFILSVSLISVLYVLIGVKLHTSRVLHPVENSSIESGDRADDTPRYRRGASQRKVIRMLIAVTLSFFLCWAPFYIQRLIASYGNNLEHPTDSFYKVYEDLSGVLYFFSTSIKPFLYYIMSNKFRDGFKATLSLWCTRRERYRLGRTYSAVLEERRKRAAEIASQRPHKPRNRRLRIATVSSQQCVAPPRAQATSRLEKKHGALLVEQRKDAAARAPRCPHYPRMLSYFANAICQQCPTPPRAQATSRLEKKHGALLVEQRKDAAARAPRCPHYPRMLSYFANAICQQCPTPPRAQATSRLEKKHGALLVEQRKDAAARAPRCPHYPRMLSYFANAICQQCPTPPRAQDRPRLDNNYRTLLEQQWNDAVLRASQWSHNQRNRRHFETATSQQCVAPPQTQARSRLENNQNAFLEEQRMDAAATIPQRPHNHQLRVTTHRAQSLNRSNLTIVVEESESLERQRLEQRADLMTSTQSISNSSLREVDLELSAEELTTLLYQVNCNILGETRDTSV